MIAWDHRIRRSPYSCFLSDNLIVSDLFNCGQEDVKVYQIWEARLLDIETSEERDITLFKLTGIKPDEY